MIIRTITKCDECLHKNVCTRLNRPSNIVNELSDILYTSLKTDTNGMDIIVSCDEFLKDFSKQRTAMISNIK